MSLYEEEYEPVLVDWAKEIWLLDPGPFTDIAFNLGYSNFVFRAAYTENRTNRQDFTKFIDLFSRGRPWQVIWTPVGGDYAVHFTSQRGWDFPVSVWQIWRASTMKLAQLSYMFEEPLPPETILGTFGAASRNESWPIATVAGQQHRVLMANAPQRDADWGQIAAYAQRLQATDSTKTLHYHGQKSVGRTIGVAAKAFDHPVRLGWDGGFPRILLPNGMVWCTGEKLKPYQEFWLRLIGVNAKDYLAIPDRPTLSRETYRINAMSLRWAFLNWDRAWDFNRVAGDEDIASAELDWEPKSLPIRLRKTKAENHLLDRWLCNTCSLQFKCPYSREGAVCIVPDSEPKQLADLMHTRSSFQIIEGLGTILAAQSKRAERGMKIEEERAREADDKGLPETGLSPEVTRILNSIFDRGVQLAKLVDPAIAARMSPKTNILNVTAGNPTSGVGPQPTPQQLMTGMKAELEQRGIALEDATDEIIEQILQESAGQSHGAIEVTSKESE